MKKELLRKALFGYALQNAFRHGKANEKAVLGKLLAERPELRSDIGAVGRVLSGVIKSVNSMSAGEIKERLLEESPGLLEKKAVKKKAELPPLPGARKGKVVMRFEPSPTGGLHLGHALTLALNSEYCKKYSGKLIVRFADTNPADVYKPAYKLIEEDIEWLVGKGFKLVWQSDNLKVYYRYAEKLLGDGKAYVCLCKSEKFRKLVLAGKACSCRELSKAEQLKRWKKMHSDYKPGEAVVRIKTSLSEKNPAVREWPAFRVSEAKHPFVRGKARVWPLMNFSVAVDDALQGMTHVIRGKDHIVNTERQKYIFRYMGWKLPHYVHTGRINFIGMRLSSSGVREAIGAGRFKGWDDIRLPFLAAFRRRGLKPEAFIKYAISLGLSRVDKTVGYEEFMKAIYAYNKPYAEKANRYFFVASPVRVRIEDAPCLKVKLDLHPSLKRGKRSFSTNKEFFLAREDFSQIKPGRIYRLMHLFSFVKQGRKLRFQSRSLTRGVRFMHWLPTSQTVKIKVFLPDGSQAKGFAEPGVKKLKVGEVVQFERFGFVCCQGKCEFWFTQK